MLMFIMMNDPAISVITPSIDFLDYSIFDTCHFVLIHFFTTCQYVLSML